MQNFYCNLMGRQIIRHDRPDVNDRTGTIVGYFVDGANFYLIVEGDDSGKITTIFGSDYSLVKKSNWR